MNQFNIKVLWWRYGDAHWRALGADLTPANLTYALCLVSITMFARHVALFSTFYLAATFDHINRLQPHSSSHLNQPQPLQLPCSSHFLPSTSPLLHSNSHGRLHTLL